MPPDAQHTDGRSADGSSTPDAPMCANDMECEDTFDCTVDTCGVGGVCRHDTLDERCEAGEMCSPAAGCRAGCANNADCNNGLYCDGVETCVAGQCFAATRPVDCDDGNECTIDSCDDVAAGCRYTPAAGCDAGVAGDGGRPVPDFDPAVHYNGHFVIAPAPSLGCPPASYAVGSLMFRVVGETLEVMADRFRLTQTPVPMDGNFAVSSSADSQCTTVSLSGTFTNANLLNATWNASCGATCGMQSRDIVGERND